MAVSSSSILGRSGRPVKESFELARWSPRGGRGAGLREMRLCTIRGRSNAVVGHRGRGLHRLMFILGGVRRWLGGP